MVAGSASLVALILTVGGVALRDRAGPVQTADAPAPIGGPFALIDGDGRVVTEASFPGAWKLIYFGYTYCPDLCPSELQTMGQALDLLGPLAGRIVPIFITIDPDRDSPRTLKDYAAAIDPRLVALGGDRAAIEAALRAFRVHAEKVGPGPGAAPDAYLMDHSAQVYLMDPSGRLTTMFGPDIGAPAMAADLRAALTRPEREK